LNVHQVVQCLETDISPMSSSFKTAWTYGKQVRKKIDASLSD
jgi:hypothetical protein